MLQLNCLRIGTVKIIFSLVLGLLVASPSFAQVENIGNQKLQLLMSKGIPVIDIRETFEWRETGIIPESHLITFFDENGEYNLKKWLSEVDTFVSFEKPLIIVCRSGRRSLILAKFLSERGKFRKIYNVTEGIKGWKRANLDTQAFF